LAAAGPVVGVGVDPCFSFSPKRSATSRVLELSARQEATSRILEKVEERLAIIVSLLIIRLLIILMIT